nr:nuclear envelope integral membrane protein 1-like [Chrysemys picta bellii]
MAGGMKPAPGRRRLRLLGTLVLLLLVGGAGAGAEGAKQPVIRLEEGRVRNATAPQQFCYTNAETPKWHDIWTRMQVGTGARFACCRKARSASHCRPAPIICIQAGSPNERSFVGFS